MEVWEVAPRRCPRRRAWILLPQKAPASDSARSSCQTSCGLMTEPPRRERRPPSTISVNVTFEAPQFSAASARHDYIFSSSQGYHRKEHPLVTLNRSNNRNLGRYTTYHSQLQRATFWAPLSRGCCSKHSGALAHKMLTAAELGLEMGTIVWSDMNLP